MYAHAPQNYKLGTYWIYKQCSNSLIGCSKFSCSKDIIFARSWRDHLKTPMFLNCKPFLINQSRSQDRVVQKFKFCLTLFWHGTRVHWFINNRFWQDCRLSLSQVPSSSCLKVVNKKLKNRQKNNAASRVTRKPLTIGYYTLLAGLHVPK